MKQSKKGGMKLPFQDRVDEFSDKLKKEATVKKALVFIFIAFVIYPVLIFIIGATFGSALPSLIYKTPEYFINSVWYSIFFNLGLFSLVVVSFLIAAKIAYNIKINPVSSAYIFGVTMTIYWSILLLFLALFFIVLFFIDDNPVSGLIGFLIGNLMIGFSLYAFFTGLRTMTGLTYTRTVLLFIATFLVLGVLIFLLQAAYYVLVFRPAYDSHQILTDTDFIFKTDEKKDGSINITQAFFYKESGKYEKACYVDFPKGWKQVNESQLEALSSRMNYSFSEFDLDNLFYNSAKNNLSEFIYFQYGFFASTPFESCEIEDGDFPYWLGIWTDFEKILKTELINFEGRGYDVCEGSGLDKQHTKIRYEFHTRFNYYNMGFYGVYEAPYGEDQDLYYILNNTRCYKYN